MSARPRPIVAFEIIQLVWIIAGAFLASMSLGQRAVQTALMLTLLFFITRRGSNIARWIYTLLMVTCLALLPLILGGGDIALIAAEPLWAALFAAVVLIVMVIAPVLLFLPSSSRWFRRTRDA